MENKSHIEMLNEKIYSLQNQQAEELKLVKEQFHHVYESVKPINMLKNAFKEMTSSPEIKGNLIDNAIGLTTGFLSKKVVFGSSINPIRNILGNVLQYAVSNIVSKHTDGIKSKGASLLLRLFDRKKDKESEFSPAES